VLIVPTYNFDVSLDDAGRSREHVTARVLDALRDRITPPDARTQPHCCFDAKAAMLHGKSFLRSAVAELPPSAGTENGTILEP